MLKTPAFIPSDDSLQPLVILLDLLQNFLRPLQSVVSGALELYFTKQSLDTHHKIGD
jgi:hypothetical protein